MSDHYRNEQEIDAVVAGFEQFTTPRDEFTHLHHLTVAVYYLRSSSFEEAVEKMRSGLIRFLDHHGVGRTKYKEQLTLAWIRLIQSVIAKLDPDLSLCEVTNVVVERLGNYRLPIEDEHRDAEII